MKAGGLFLGGIAAFGVAFLATLAIPQPSGQVTVVGAVTPGDCARFASVTQLQDGGATCPGLAPVQSVFGRTGAVVGLLGDYTPATGGTGINNGTNTITVAGNFATSGAFPFTLTATATTNSTFPAGTHTIGGLDVTQVWSAPQTFNDNDFLIAGLTSGNLIQRCAAICGSSVIRWPAGSTDFSATGGASQVVKQVSAGGPLTVAQLAMTDLTISTLANSAPGNVALNNTGTFFDGPSVAQGTLGTWLAMGGVSMTDSAGNAQFICKLWDGTTTVHAGTVTNGGAGGLATMHLSGIFTAPAGNIKISCKDVTSVNGNILSNSSGTTKDATVSVFRIN